MNRLIASLAAAVSLVPGAQALSPLGADAASFDQLLENAYLRRDVAFVEAAVIDDVTFAADPDPNAKAWTKRELVNAVRFFDGIARNVDAVHVPGVLRSADGASLPQLLREVKPRYTGEAMRAQIEGTVLLEVVVNTDGTVGDVFVVGSLDRAHGLDEQAVEAARRWQFRPGLRNGEPVPVLITMSVTFTLRK